ncbi:hypothetical protein SRHO_G00214890 [Serrasalmus rhombeus]
MFMTHLLGKAIALIARIAFPLIVCEQSQLLLLWKYFSRCGWLKPSSQTSAFSPQYGKSTMRGIITLARARQKRTAKVDREASEGMGDTVSACLE